MSTPRQTVQEWLDETTKIVKEQLRRQDTADILGADLGVIEGMRWNFTAADVTDDIQESVGSKFGQAKTLPKLTAVELGSGQSFKITTTETPEGHVVVTVEVVVGRALQTPTEPDDGWDRDD